jgi:hypothetical protein
VPAAVKNYDLEAFKTWNPLALKEPAAKIQYEGAADSTGVAFQSFNRFDL